MTVTYDMCSVLHLILHHTLGNKSHLQLHAEVPGEESVVEWLSAGCVVVPVMSLSSSPTKVLALTPHLFLLLIELA